MQAMMGFMRDVWRAPIGVRIWLGVLMGVNGVAPLFFLGTIEGKLVLGLMMISATAMVALHTRLGYTRLLGVGHAPWIPMVAFLVLRLGAEPAASTAQGAWMITSIVVSSLSLLIDGVEIVRYARGDRQPIL